MEGIGTAAETRDQFLQLLVTQLRHQDPLEPTKQEDFLGQLAQFSTLEGVEKINENLDQFLSSQLESQTAQNSFLVELQQFQNMASAAGLVGKEVDFITSGDVQTTGSVDAVVIQEDSIFLRVDDELVPLDQIREISSEASDEPLATPTASRDTRLP